MTSYPTTTSFNTTVSVGAQGGGRIIGAHADAEAVMHRKKGFTRRMYVLQEIASRLGVKYQILTCKSRSCELSTAKNQTCENDYNVCDEYTTYDDFDDYDSIRC